MSMKFGLQVEFNLLKTATSTNTKPEEVLSCRSCHLENRYDVITAPRVVRFG